MSPNEILILNGLATGGKEARQCCLSHGLDRECFEAEESKLFFDAVGNLTAENREMSSAAIVTALRKLKMKKKDADAVCGFVYSCEDAVSGDEYENIVSDLVRERLQTLEKEAYVCFSGLTLDSTSEEIAEAQQKHNEFKELKQKYAVRTDNIDVIIDECRADAEKAVAGEKRERLIPMSWVKDFSDEFYDIERDEFIVIGASQGGGKSSFAVTMENDIIDCGGSYFKGSFEMSIRELASVTAGQRSRTNPRKMERERPERVQAYYDELENLRQLYRDGRIGFSHSEQIDMFLADYERFKLEKGKPTCVIVDYLQLMKCSQESIKLGRNYQLAEISRKLKKITIVDGIPVVALVQLNKNAKHEGREPRKEDIKDCNDIVSDANRIWLLEQPKLNKDGFEQYKEWAKEIIWIQDKCRGGPWHRRWIDFNGPQRRFHDGH